MPNVTCHAEHSRNLKGSLKATICMCLKIDHPTNLGWQ